MKTSALHLSSLQKAYKVSREEGTEMVQVAERVVTCEQRPFVEADVKKAKRVLERLAKRANTPKASSARRIYC